MASKPPQSKTKRGRGFRSAGATARQLEDAILVRARQLKIADREAG